MGDEGVCSSLPVCYVLSTSIKGLRWLGVAQVWACLRCWGLGELTLLLSGIPSTWVGPRWIFLAWTLICQVLPPRQRTDVSSCLPPSSYIHVTCQHVIKDKVLQTDFSFTTLSLCCFVCVSWGGNYSRDQIGFMKKKKTEVDIVSFITNALNITSNKCLGNDGHYSLLSQ